MEKHGVKTSSMMRHTCNKKSPPLQDCIHVTFMDTTKESKCILCEEVLPAGFINPSN
jgi:hypothetical protein